MNLFSSLDLGLFFISAYVGFYNLFLFLNNKKEIEKLHFALLCFFIAMNDIACIGLYNASSISSGTFWQKMQFFCTIAISAEFVNFTYQLLKRKSDLTQKIFLSVLGLILLCGIAFNGFILDDQLPLKRVVTLLGESVTYYENQPGIIWNILFIVMLGGMIYLYTLLIKEFLVKKRKDIIPLMAGFFLFFVSAIIDILISLNVIVFLYTIEYAFLIIILLSDHLLLNQFLALFHKVEKLNITLEEKVEERTHEIKKMARKLVEANEALEKKNVILLDLSERDSLTELLNHATFHRRLSELFNMAKRQNFPISAMILDIDFFKDVNDNYGHPAGDSVITIISQFLKHDFRDYDIKSRFYTEEQVVRNYDLTGRYGGDEFAIAIPFCGENEARIIAERICEKIRNHNFTNIPKLKITCSIGCVILQNYLKCKNEMELMKKADEALYKAKETGRDQVNYIILQ